MNFSRLCLFPYLDQILIYIEKFCWVSITCYLCEGHSMRKEINITTYKQDKQRNCNLLRWNNQYQYRWLFCWNYFPQDTHKSKYLKIGFISAGKKRQEWKKNRKQLISISNPPGKEYPFVDKPFRMVKDVLLCSTVTLRNNINPSNNASSVILNFNWIK